MILCEHVFKHYSGKPALVDIHFELPQGEMAFLTGASGAGKSTLLKLIALHERATRGKIVVNHQRLNDVSMRQLPYFRRDVSMIFQDHRLLMDRTVYDNVALPLIIAGFRYAEVRRRVQAALDKVGLLFAMDRYPVALSSGEQQRVGIARAVVNKPAVLLADEPTGNLDPELSQEIMALFAEFNRVGVTILIASHNIALIERMSYPRLMLDKGQLVRIEEQGAVVWQHDEK